MLNIFDHLLKRNSSSDIGKLTLSAFFPATLFPSLPKQGSSINEGHTVSRVKKKIIHSIIMYKDLEKLI